MANTDVQAAVTLHSPVKTRSDKAERYLRRTTAWMMLIFLLQGQLGAIWDREWHYFVGRDWFWTPPHILIYSCVAGAGLLALLVVLTDTIRYYKGAAGVDDTSTIPVLRLLHAPLGFVIAGFGALLALIAAPLDNYWHNLYGIDIALWAPFHMMGVTGAVIGNLGMIYVFASEAAIERDAAAPHMRIAGLSLLEWGTLFVIAGMINFTFIGFEQFPIATFGLLRIPTYALPIAMCGTLALIGASRLTRLPGTATLIIFLLLLHTFLEELFVPWAIRTAVVWQDLSYRVSSIPSFNTIDALLPLVFLIAALIIDGLALWRLKHNQQQVGHHSWLLGMIITIPQLLILPCMHMRSLNLIAVFLGQNNALTPPDLAWQVILIAVPAILAFGAAGAVIGAIYGDIWRLNKR